MSSSNKLYTITEYGGFTCGTAAYGYKALPERTFKSLEDFILANPVGGGTEAVELLSLSVRRGIGKIITARNYVGIITMTDGTVIEILPKIANQNITEAETRRIFLEMLKAMRDVSFKNFNVANLNTDRLNLFEIFIRMFLEEVTILTKQGLKSSYVAVESNERFYKGKLIASQNIKHNLVNKSNFYVRFDEFSINRAENHLIKSTLRFLLKATSDGMNRRNAVRLLSHFEGVEYSINFDSDFTKCVADRGMNHYNKVLSWCRVFLKGNSFTAFSGSNVALALLFPMEKVFESFVASKFRKHIRSGTSLLTQDAKYSLFDQPTKAFGLRPDIVLTKDGKTIVMDTKWKLLSSKARNYGISQPDMYQMYAYSKKYNAEKVVLIYPQSENLPASEISFKSDDSVEVEVSFINLMRPDASIHAIMSTVIS